MIKKYFLIMAACLLSCGLSAPAGWAGHLQPSINAKVIRYLITTNMDVFEVYGVLIIPLRYQFAWVGAGPNEAWKFKGYTIHKMDMFGVKYESTKNIQNWNSRLLPDSQTQMMNPKSFRQFMTTAFKMKILNKQHYKGVDYNADAYLWIRIKPGGFKIN